MSTYLPQEITPIIIKGGKGGILATRIKIEANSVFVVTQQSQPLEWTQSDSNYTVSYIESLVVGEMGVGEQQFCQTATMAHPLTYTFMDAEKNPIFTVQEIADGGNFKLQITVDAAGDYFEVTQDSKAAPDAWTESTFSSTDAVVYMIEVKDSTNTPVCQLVRSEEEDIFLDLEPT